MSSDEDSDDDGTEVSSLQGIDGNYEEEEGCEEEMMMEEETEEVDDDDDSESEEENEEEETEEEEEEEEEEEVEEHYQHKLMQTNHPIPPEYRRRCVRVLDSMMRQRGCRFPWPNDVECTLKVNRGVDSSDSMAATVATEHAQETATVAMRAAINTTLLALSPASHILSAGSVCIVSAPDTFPEEEEEEKGTVDAVGGASRYRSVAAKKNESSSPSCFSSSSSSEETIKFRIATTGRSVADRDMLCVAINELARSSTSEPEHLADLAAPLGLANGDTLAMVPVERVSLFEQTGKANFGRVLCPRRGRMLVLFLNMNEDGSGSSLTPSGGGGGSIKTIRGKGGGGNSAADGSSSAPSRKRTRTASTPATIKAASGRGFALGTSGGGKNKSGKSVGVKEINDVIALGRQQGVQHMLLVVQNKITPKSKLYLNNCGMTWEVFTYSEIIVDISTHRLVPLHRVVDNVIKRREVVKRFCCRQHEWNNTSSSARPEPSKSLSEEPIPLSEQLSSERNRAHKCTRDVCWCLPRILITDPMGRFLNIRVGEVVKILKPSSTNCLQITYRVGANREHCH